MPVKPGEAEEQYFLEQHLKQQLAKARAEAAEQAEKEKQRLKELHWMHCPKCGQKLVSEKYGKDIEIDVCPGCKGLWLDANELNRILASKESTSPFRSLLKIVGK